MENLTYDILVYNSHHDEKESAKESDYEFIQFMKDKCAERGFSLNVSKISTQDEFFKKSDVILHPDNFWYVGLKKIFLFDSIMSVLADYKKCEKFVKKYSLNGVI